MGNARTAEILGVFQREIGLPDVDASDSFFDLGGDSLMAERIIMRLNEMYGTGLPTSALLESPTPGDLARLIDVQSRQEDYARLVTLLPDCSGTIPAAMVHGMSGSPLFVSRMGEGFKTRCRIAGLRGMGLMPGEEAPTTAEDIADAYLEGLKARFGQSPSVYGGICVGGLVAIDLAHRHFQTTRQRPLIVLIDPPPPGSAWLRPLADNRMTDRRARQLDRQTRSWRRFRDQLDRMGFGQTALGRKARRETFKKSLKLALAGYTPEPFPCELLMIASSEWGRTTAEEYRDWAGSKASVTIEVLPGQHGGFQSANKDAIDGIISGFLDKHLRASDAA